MSNRSDFDNRSNFNNRSDGGSRNNAGSRSGAGYRGSVNNNNSRGSRKRNGSSNSGKISLPVILLIVILCFVALFLGVIWKFQFGGITVEYDPDYVPDISLNAEDNILYPLDADLEGYEDDGTDTILCLGNDVFSYDKDEETGLANMIADKTGATVYNVSFPGTTVAYAPLGMGTEIDTFSFVGVAKAIGSGDYSELSNKAGDMGVDYVSSVDVLKGIDFNKVDTLCIMYDGNDYIQKRTLYNPTDVDNLLTPGYEFDEYTYMGGFVAGVKAIHEAYPHIRIVVNTFTYCLAPNDTGAMQPGDALNYGNGTLTDYYGRLFQATESLNVSFIDDYMGFITESNSEEYLNDNIHLNVSARQYVAYHFALLIYPQSVAGKE